MNATLTNRLDADQGTVVGSAAPQTGWAPVSRPGNIPRAAIRFDGPRNKVDISRTVGTSPGRVRIRASLAAGHEWSQLNAALAFFVSRQSAGLSDDRTGWLRV